MAYYTLKKLEGNWREGSRVWWTWSSHAQERTVSMKGECMEGVMAHWQGEIWIKNWRMWDVSHTAFCGRTAREKLLHKEGDSRVRAIAGQWWM